MLTRLRIGMRLGLAFGLLTLLCLTLGAVAMQGTRAMNDRWQLFQQDAGAKRAATTRGIAALGDGIHHFKNFILRGADYAKLFGADMDAIERIAEDYKATGHILASSGRSPAC